MAVHISGSEIHKVREALGLSVAHFSAILGVHSSTVHRWETAGAEKIPIDGVAANVLLACKQRLLGHSPRAQKVGQLGDQVTQALLLGGALLALGILIQHITKND